MIWRISASEPVEAWLETAYLNRLRATSPEEAFQWYSSLKAAIADLAVFPRRWSAFPGSERYDGEVRRMIFGKKRGAYHIIYRVIEPAPGENFGIVRVINIYHAMTNRDESPERS